MNTRRNKMSRSILALALSTAKAQRPEPRPHVADDDVESWAMVSCWTDPDGRFRRDYHPIRKAPVPVVYGEVSHFRQARIDARRQLAMVEAAYDIHARMLAHFAGVNDTFDVV